MHALIAWLGGSGISLLILFWVLDGFEWIAGILAGILAWRVNKAEVRHRQQVELEYARRGLPLPPREKPGTAKAPRPETPAGSIPPIPPIPPVPPVPAMRMSWHSRDEDWNDAGGNRDGEDEERHLPAAVIPAPPGAKPRVRVLGPCRHEQIIPVIGADGELKRWICANYPRCDAEFGKSVAVYEDEQGERQ